ncbi:MAG: thermonuclease family protein [Bacilli bacterium]|nr:thermonuclease family protein [Bacilli bacterium]
MKKILFLAIILFLNLTIVKAQEKIEVTFAKCVDGDTAYFYLDDEEIKFRFLAIDTPESTTTIEPYGKEASEFTCNLLKTASKIEIEYDDNSDKTDKYDRELAWIFVDNNLLQDLIIKEGLAKVAYLYGNYKYTYILEASEIEAKNQKLNIWSEKTANNSLYYITAIIIFIMLLIFNKKYRNKILKKTLKKISL